MRILFVESRTQQCPSILMALDRMGHEVADYPKTVENIMENEQEQQMLEEFLRLNNVDVLLTNLFVAVLAQITNQLDIKLAAWCMDSPAYYSWCTEAEYDNCYLFYFDHKEYELRRQSGQSNVYYLPLAADTAWAADLVITDEEIKRYGCDISFVGSLYTHNLYNSVIENFTPKEQEMFMKFIGQSAFRWDGQDRPHIPDEITRIIQSRCPELFDRPYIMPDEYYLRTFFIGRKQTNVERTSLLEMLSQQYMLHLYTREGEYVPDGIMRFGEVDGASDALRVYYSSKINLNITLRSIASGVPERVYDVMSVGGFVLSNWQEEIPDLFVEDKEIVTYRTPEELLDKTDYYLKHETERLKIAVNGYQKVKRCYTYDKQLQKLLDKIK